MPGEVRVEKSDGVGWIVFDHRDRRNAITRDMWRAIPVAAREVSEDEAVRVVILRGAGDEAFVSGADISEFEEARSGASSVDYETDNRNAFEALAAIEKPVVASIRGFCVGGGVGIAVTADLRYAADDAVFAVPAARLGLGYPADALETLVGLVGPAAAKELFFTARRFEAEDALRMGLVDAVVPSDELSVFVRERAREIAANAPLTLRSVKRIVSEMRKPPSERDRKAVEASIRRCYESEDYAEGVRAFLEKRKPVFRGR